MAKLVVHFNIPRCSPLCGFFNFVGRNEIVGEKRLYALKPKGLCKVSSLYSAKRNLFMVRVYLRKDCNLGTYQNLHYTLLEESTGSVFGRRVHLEPSVCLDCCHSKNEDRLLAQSIDWFPMVRT